VKSFQSIFFLSILLTLSNCAKQSAPQGGPRDEDPPQLLEADPVDQSLNTKPEEINLIFDEYIKLDNPSKNIIITPRLNKDEIVTTALKNTLNIKLNQDLEENTTYVFNFQKSVQDFSEGNPAENLKLVFSTGPTIDSLEVTGSINYYFPERRTEYKNVIVGLYPENDTTDLFTASPYYISQVDTAGNYKITNIKNGRYRAYAWNDENNSLKAEYKSEQNDFILDTLDINENIAGLNFNLSLSDLTPLRLLRSSYSNGSYDFILNKNPIEISLENEELGQSIFYTKEDKRIKLFSDKVREDSLSYKINLIDSVGNKVDTLIWAKFPENNRKPDELTTSTNAGKNFMDTLRATFTFSRPIIEINTDSLFIPIDSTTRIAIKEDMFFFKDSLMRNILEFNIPLTDSTKIESFVLTAADSTFKDIQGQYNEKAITANYKKIRPETLADLIQGTILDATGPFIVQLLDSKGNLYRELFIEEGNTYQFDKVEAGSYQIRVIEDKNSNRRWDPGNFFENRQAEKVYYYLAPETNSKSIVIRGGWTNEGLDITPSKTTGLESNKPVENPE